MQNKNKKGFTLIELLVVVLIIGILSAVALPQYSTAVEKARSAEALALMNSVASAAERYCFQKDVWPASMANLDIEVPKISGTPNYGGKNFSLAFSSGANSDCLSTSLVITATRTAGDVYALKTTLTPDSNTETITATRSCQPTEGNAKSEKYCNAITNGHNASF